MHGRLRFILKEKATMISQKKKGSNMLYESSFRFVGHMEMRLEMQFFMLVFSSFLDEDLGFFLWGI